MRLRMALTTAASAMIQTALLSAEPEIGFALYMTTPATNAPESTPDINQTLSEQRVMAVRQYLVTRGIDANRITTAAHGDTVQPFTGEKNRAVTCRIR